MSPLLLEIETLGPWHPGSGEPGERDLDAVASRDAAGFPWLPGKTLKGLLREASRLAEDFNQLPPGWTVWAWGGRSSAENPDASPGALDVRAAQLPLAFREWCRALPLGQLESVRQAFFYDIASTALDENEMAKDLTLRRIECVTPVTLHAVISQKPGAVEFDDHASVASVRRLAGVLPLLRRLGSHRTRGWGRCRVTAAPLLPATAV